MERLSLQVQTAYAELVEQLVAGEAQRAGVAALKSRHGAIHAALLRELR